MVTVATDFVAEAAFLASFVFVLMIAFARLDVFCSGDYADADRFVSFLRGGPNNWQLFGSPTTQPPVSLPSRSVLLIPSD